MVSRYAARELPGAQHPTEIRRKSDGNPKSSSESLCWRCCRCFKALELQRRPKRLQSCALESMLDTQGAFDTVVWVCFSMFLVLCQMHKTFRSLSLACYSDGSDAELGPSSSHISIVEWTNGPFLLAPAQRVQLFSSLYMTHRSNLLTIYQFSPTQVFLILLIVSY